MRMRFVSMGALALLVLAASASSAVATRATAGGGFVPQALQAPRIPGLVTARHTSSTACVLPDGTNISWFHCYTPQQIRSAYGVDSVAPLSGGLANEGQGQTIVLVDAYGSPTAAADLQTFHDTFFPRLPDPSFEQVFPQGNPQFHNACTS